MSNNELHKTKINTIVKFILFFVGYFALFYFGFHAINAFSAPGGYYSEFIAAHLNIIEGFRHLILQTCSHILTATGKINHIAGRSVKIPHGRGIILNNSCLGLGIISFWWALILAFPSTLRWKVIFFLVGTITITALNIARVTTLAYIFNSDWGMKHPNFDHHFAANLIIYAVLGVLIHLWFGKTPVSANRISKTVSRAAQ